MKHGRHWPREEQNTNAREGFGNLSGDPAAAARVRAAWAALLPLPDADDGLSEYEFEITQGVRRA